jgi:hypothetical protein
MKEEDIMQTPETKPVRCAKCRVVYDDLKHYDCPACHCEWKYKA